MTTQGLFLCNNLKLILGKKFENVSVEKVMKEVTGKTNGKISYAEFLDYLTSEDHSDDLVD